MSSRRAIAMPILHTTTCANVPRKKKPPATRFRGVIWRFGHRLSTHLDRLRCTTSAVGMVCTPLGTKRTSHLTAAVGWATRGRLSSRKSSGRLASQNGSAPPKSARRANSARAASDRARLLYHARRRRSVSSAGSLPRESATASSRRCSTSAAATERLNDSVKPNLRGPHGQPHSPSPRPRPHSRPRPRPRPHSHPRPCPRPHSHPRPCPRPALGGSGAGGACGGGAEGAGAASAHGQVDAPVCAAMGAHA